ncbi:MAG TPA: hypothetical protein PKM65_20265 [Spirochaetota bacterium]|nr:hypothetical protein [Spirochaetota bacterium]
MKTRELIDHIDDLLKAKDISKLVKKQITTKRGHRMTVWVKPDKKVDAEPKPKARKLDLEIVGDIKQRIRDLYAKKKAGTITSEENSEGNELISKLPVYEQEKIIRELDPILANKKYGRKEGDTETEGSIQNPSSLSDQQIKEHILEISNMSPKQIRKNLKVVEAETAKVVYEYNTGKRDKANTLAVLKKLNYMRATYQAGVAIKHGSIAGKRKENMVVIADAMKFVKDVIAGTVPGHFKDSPKKEKAAPKSKAKKKVDEILQLKPEDLKPVKEKEKKQKGSAKRGAKKPDIYEQVKQKEAVKPGESKDD